MGNKNVFGGPWTENKIDVFIGYLRAYLKIMNRQRFRLIYFDGFAGSGEIEQGSNYTSLIEGVASKVIDISEPRDFDVYYLVELDREKATYLETYLSGKFPGKFMPRKIYVEAADCNDKLIDLANHLKNNPYTRVLAFIDPKGMQLKWKSVEIFKDLGVDFWILVPSGIGYNRLLTSSGNISPKWMEILITSLGLTEDEIKKEFYKVVDEETLFGPLTSVHKENDAIDKVISLYIKQLKKVFKFVSEPLEMKNSKGSTMYHFILATNNKAGLKIANYIINKTSRND